MCHGQDSIPWVAVCLHRLFAICCYSRPGGLKNPNTSWQRRCAEAAEGIAASLDARLLALPHPEAAGCGDARYSPIATQALLLGRVALGLASRSSMLPVVLGPPDQWRASVIGGADAEAAGRRPLLGPRLPAGAPAAPAPSARYERLQQRLHSGGLQGYGKWASWASVGLASALVAGLSADHTLAADVPLRSWDETVIGGAGKDELALEAEPAGSGLEMRFQLPAAPSPAAVLLALAACQEVDRAGSRLPSPPAQCGLIAGNLQHLDLGEWEVAGVVLLLMHTRCLTCFAPAALQAGICWRRSLCSCSSGACAAVC